ncbi:2',5'-phosphodiesterase 12 [Microplitis mediator]|uniref:2',5'-phosphodiesterase 12 n=1 Tax=Microplitis mediator TaxID=375433 RepID=UPI002554BE7E|nr:2',5'-phosphodiesterase 12 [Microplitis mediator]
MPMVLNYCRANNQLGLLIVNKINNLFVRTNCKTVFKMNEAYLRYTAGNETFDFTFRFSKPEINVDRQFNFSRRTSENVENFLRRLDANMTKVLDKKTKKLMRRNKKKLSSSQEDLVEEQVDNVKAGNIFLIKDNDKMNLLEPCSKFLEDSSQLKISILGKMYDVKLNAPWIVNVTLPTCILANFPVYPSEFDSIHVDRKLSDFTWYKMVLDDRKKTTWELVGEGFLYTPSAKDVGAKLKLKCLPRNERLEGPEIEVEAKVDVEAGPGVCPFETRHAFTRNKLTDDYFRVTSYNILADTYADSDYSRDVLFSYCPPYALAIDYRKLLIIKELIGYNSDIICLQEVDSKVYENDLQPSLSLLNYGGVFFAKGITSEGSAIMYDNKRFEILDHKGIVMSEGIESNLVFKDTWDKITNEDAKQRFKDRNTSILIVVLKSLDNPKEILVIGNTHLYFHPDADHIRLLQSYFSLTACQDTADKIRQQYPEHNVTMMLCGDFNSTPVDGVYEFVTKNNIPADHKDWSSNAEQKIENVSVSHNLALKSACGTPEYTNFTVEFADCLDYIFYESNKLEVSQVIPMPSKEELALNSAIPSVVFPSDHIALCVDMKWRSPQ